MKIINKEIIKQAAQSLMREHKFTTALDVKMKLSIEGYLAFQFYVSDCMKALCKEEKWDFTFNGKHFIYKTFNIKDILHSLRVFSIN